MAYNKSFSVSFQCGFEGFFVFFAASPDRTRLFAELPHITIVCRTDPSVLNVNAASGEEALKVKMRLRDREPDIENQILRFMQQFPDIKIEKVE